MSSEIAIRCRGLTKDFKNLSSPVAQLFSVFGFAPPSMVGRKNVLRGIDFEIAKGEKVGILGVNGAGKSTLLQIMAGMSKPTSGSLDITGSVGAILELGAGFHPELTGRQNAETLLLLNGTPRPQIAERIEEVIAFSGLGPDIDVKTRTYSSGMLVRLAFAVATSGTPDIFIVDEALAVGDGAFQQKCFHHLQGTLADSTLVLISHDMVAVSALCSRAIILDGGKIVFDGSPHEAMPLYNRIVHGRPGSVSPTTGLIPDDLKSGPRKIDIVAARLLLDGVAATAVAPGQTLEVVLDLHNDGGPTDIVTGIAAGDVRGQRIFGQNTERGAPMRIGPGNSRVSMRFEWPSVAAGGYFLTPGISSSVNGLLAIECWANNVIEIKAVLDENSHGLFNVGLVNELMENADA
ncbi:ABC transporter ATP-binding protein [Rhizobium laguerreae]|uniref:ABC transporter ATP-binding protein n=1 Tax=Rhizobium laguerreae TaxID=1076926 RepID=UPI001C913058|nr:ABC transporter ATP-binding protein [Rhizobium laguerreae]MBY3150866.1 ABC transporter ATP-binding protein [Rhizobium laguerreae]